mgnify:FL=1
MNTKNTARSSYVNSRIESRTKKDAESVFRELGISQSEAVRLFYRQVIIHRGIPFDIRIPNKETIAAFSELSNERRTLQSYHSAKEMLADVLPKSVQKRK